MVALGLNDRLLEVLRETTGRAQLAYASPPEPLTGGFWAELLEFSVVGAPDDWPSELVARLMPDEAMARKETAIQAAVAAAGYPTPVVRASGDASAFLGRAFMIMDRAPGAMLLAGLNGLAALARLPELARRIPDVLARSMAALHALDPSSVRQELEGVRDVVTDLPSMFDAFARGTAMCDRPDLEAAAAALRSYGHDVDTTVICHGDLHPFNLLIDADGIVTVLDWSASILAPRAYDVAFTSLLLSEPPLAVPAPLKPVVTWVGRRLGARFVRRYEQYAHVTIDPETLAHFQAVICLRALVEVAHWVAGGVAEERAGHPWLTNGASFASRLSTVTGVDVQPR
jgi:aminoglycoside phosphotransferase (APT) family kinase protein